MTIESLQSDLKESDFSLGPSTAGAYIGPRIYWSTNTMEGGNLEDAISDRAQLWRNRISVAVDIVRALVFLHHECYPAIVHRDVKASNVLLDRYGKAHVTDFGLARVVDTGDTHVSMMVAGTIGYVTPEYGQTWQTTTKGDVYSYGVLAMELAPARQVSDGGEEECLVEWARRVVGVGRDGVTLLSAIVGLGLEDDMHELLRIAECYQVSVGRHARVRIIAGRDHHRIERPFRCLLFTLPDSSQIRSP